MPEKLDFYVEMTQKQTFMHTSYFNCAAKVLLKL